MTIKFQLMMTLSSYPSVYCVIVIPLSGVRWSGFTQEIESGVNPTPAESNFGVLALFGLSGFLNAILLLTTRPQSGLFGKLMFTSEARPPSPPMAEVPYVQEENLWQAVPEDAQSLGRLP